MILKDFFIFFSLFDFSFLFSLKFICFLNEKIITPVFKEIHKYPPSE